MWHALLTVGFIVVFAFFAGLWALFAVGLLRPLRASPQPPPFRSRADNRSRGQKRWIDRFMDAVLAALLLSLLLLAGIVVFQWLLAGP